MEDDQKRPAGEVRGPRPPQRGEDARLRSWRRCRAWRTLHSKETPKFQADAFVAEIKRLEGPVDPEAAKRVELDLQRARKDQLIEFMELDGVEYLARALSTTANEAARLEQSGGAGTGRGYRDSTLSFLRGLKNCMNFKDGIQDVIRRPKAIEAIVFAYAPDGLQTSEQALKLLSVIAAFSEDALVCGAAASAVSVGAAPLASAAAH